MKKLIFGMLAVGVLPFLIPAPASAWTCKERMDSCHAQSGSDLCYQKNRCQGGVYLAPSGRSWPVDGKHEKNVGKKK